MEKVEQMILKELQNQAGKRPGNRISWNFIDENSQKLTGNQSIASDGSQLARNPL